MIDELSRRGFVRLLGAAMTVPTLGALGLKPDSPLVVAHTLDALGAPAGTDPMRVVPLLKLDQQWIPGERVAWVQVDGVSISSGQSTGRQNVMRWVATPDADIALTEGQALVLELSVHGGVLHTNVTRRTA